MLDIVFCPDCDLYSNPTLNAPVVLWTGSLRVISWYFLSPLDPLLTTLKWNIDVIVNSDLLMLNGLESNIAIEYSFCSSLRKLMFTKCLQLQVLVIKFTQIYWVSIRKPEKKSKLFTIICLFYSNDHWWASMIEAFYKNSY